MTVEQLLNNEGKFFHVAVYPRSFLFFLEIQASERKKTLERYFPCVQYRKHTLKKFCICSQQQHELEQQQYCISELYLGQSLNNYKCGLGGFSKSVLICTCDSSKANHHASGWMYIFWQTPRGFAGWTTLLCLVVLWPPTGHMLNFVACQNPSLFGPCLPFNPIFASSPPLTCSCFLVIIVYSQFPHASWVSLFLYPCTCYSLCLKYSVARLASPISGVSSNILYQAKIFLPLSQRFITSGSGWIIKNKHKLYLYQTLEVILIVCQGCKRSIQ